MGTKAEKPALERRSYEFQIRAAEGERGHFITGRPIVFGSRTDLGWFDEVIEPGALDRTDLTDVRFLINHNTEMIPLARSRRNNANSTMLLAVVPEGLDIVRIDLDVENNVDARALYSAVERGDISGMSFMFSIRDEEWDDLDSEHPTRRIKDIASVVEVSAVTWPAYEATEIFARSKEALENARTALEKARQQRTANAPEGADTTADALALAKAKINIITGG